MIDNSVIDLMQSAEKKLQELEKALEPNQTDIAKQLINLASYNMALNYYIPAQKLNDRAYDIYGKIRKYNDPDRVSIINNTAVIYFCLGDFNRARSIMLAAWEMVERLYGGFPKKSIAAKILNNYSICLLKCCKLENVKSSYEKRDKSKSYLPGKLDIAIDRCLIALDIWEGLEEPNHHEIAYSQKILSLIYDYIGEKTNADSYSKKASVVNNDEFEYFIGRDEWRIPLEKIE